MAESNRKLIYIYMPALSEKNSRNIGTTDESEIRTAWLNAMQKEFPLRTEKTVIRRTDNIELVGIGVLRQRSNSVPAFVAVFNTEAKAKRFMDFLKESDVQKRYDDIVPRVHGYGYAPDYPGK